MKKDLLKFQRKQESIDQKKMMERNLKVENIEKEKV